jgi:transcription initiation factor IIE alpha subunit
MPYCPECGGKMRYVSLTKRYSCMSCGLTLTYQELIEMRERLTTRVEPKEEERKRLRKEYLEWWLSSKKK